MTSLSENNIIGKLTEMEAIAYFIKHGYKVYTPVIDNGIDFIVFKDNKYMSVQVKNRNCRTSANSRSACYSINGPQNKENVRAYITADLLYVQTPEHRYLIPLLEPTYGISIRVDGSDKYSEYKID